MRRWSLRLPGSLHPWRPGPLAFRPASGLLDRRCLVVQQAAAVQARKGRSPSNDTSSSVDNVPPETEDFRTIGYEFLRETVGSAGFQHQPLVYRTINRIARQPEVVGRQPTQIGSGAAVAPHPVTFRDRGRRLQQLQTAASNGVAAPANRDRSHEGERWRKSMAVDHDLVSR